MRPHRNFGLRGLWTRSFGKNEKNLGCLWTACWTALEAVSCERKLLKTATASLVFSQCIFVRQNNGFFLAQLTENWIMICDDLFSYFSWNSNVSRVRSLASNVPIDELLQILLFKHVHPNASSRHISRSLTMIKMRQSHEMVLWMQWMRENALFLKSLASSHQLKRRPTGWFSKLQCDLVEQGYWGFWFSSFVSCAAEM